MPSKAPWVLAIGGFDSSGAAGLDADREAAAAFGVDLVAVATAHTHQDRHAVHALGERDPDEWRFDALAAMSRENPSALKFGLLPGREHLVAALAVVDQLLFESPETPIVLDPVIASTSGHTFLAADALPALVTLASRPLYVTPNLPEAAALTGAPLDLLAQDLGARLAAAQTLLLRGARGVSMKGGHGNEHPLVDLLLVPNTAPEWIERPRRPGAGIRGSGCRFATGFASGLALARPPATAARRAGDWVASLIGSGR